MCLFFRTKKRALLSVLVKAFPKHLASDVKAVCNALRITDGKRGSVFYYDHTTEWKLTSGDRITIPYRIYISDELLFPMNMTAQQELIYHCICSRNHNGYIRQKHIEALLQSDPPEWAKPYIIKICDEYIVEILEAVYRTLKDRNCEEYKVLCALNINYIRLGHFRMISYWNEFYRWDCYRYNDYIGKKLYAECFGYHKTGQRSIQF